MTKLDRRNKYCSGSGTIGGGMFYSMRTIVVGCVVCRKKYRIDEATYQDLIKELKERGDIK